MRKIQSIIVAMAAGTAMLICVPAVSAKEKPSGEERLAKMLEGREAGEPQSCITLSSSQNLQVIDGTALVYKSGGTIYVNRPSNPDSLRYHDVLIMKRTSSQLCKLDIVTTADQTSGMFTGSVFLGDFVPYRKVEASPEE